MTVSQTPRFMLKKYSSGGDPHPSRVEFNSMIDGIENNAAMYSQGPTGSRPAAGKRGRTYWDETVKRKYYDDGTAWQDQNPNGGGGPGTKIVPGEAAAEGSSAKAARADHTHKLELATAAADGAMSKDDKAKLDAATGNNVEGTIVQRGTGGRVNVGEPTAAPNAATKNYVDGQIGALGNDAADYADAAVANAPAATTTVAGKMSAADKVKLNAASSAATPGTLMMTDAAGRYKAAAPATSTDVANKGYVDTAVSGANNYADDAVAAVPLVSSTVDGLMRKADKTKLDNSTSAATASAVMQRDSNGRVSVADPASAGHAATKAYVDTAETDAKTYADAAVNADRPVFASFTPVWSGLENLGTTGLIQSGQYAKIGPNLVRADLRLRAGTGGALGTGRISVSLPFPAAGAIMQFGSGALLPTGLDGVVRKVEVGARPGNTTAEIWAPATPTEVLKTPGEAGYPFSKNAEIHVSITYQTAAA